MGVNRRLHVTSQKAFEVNFEVVVSRRVLPRMVQVRSWKSPFGWMDTWFSEDLRGYVCLGLVSVQAIAIKAFDGLGDDHVVELLLRGLACRP